MTVLIFANGDMDVGEWVRPRLVQAAAVLAADGGSRHLHRLDFPPNVVIGDMDSLTSDIREWLAANRTQMITHPEEKDETDLELALLYAAAAYPNDIHVYGAMGGRLDQLLANVLLLAHPALEGRHVEIVSRYQRAWLLHGRQEIRGKIGERVSLIPLAGKVKVHSTFGLKWPLSGDTLTFGPARGISNVLTAVPARITLESGQLVCVHTVKSWER